MSKAPALSTEPVYDKVEQQASSFSVEESSIENVYYIQEIADHIISHGYKSPCLQFPDSLVQDSARVASVLQEKIGGPAYVLADTAYSPCCVDEIAAQHVKGDIVYHFGSACLNPTRTLPVTYVRRQEIKCNLDAIKNQLDGRPTILYPDTKYTDIALQLASDSVIVAVPSSDTADFIPALPHFPEEATEVDLPNRKLTKPVESLNEYSLLYLTDSPSESLMLHWSTVFDGLKAINGAGKELDVRPMLRKRYLYVQNIKAAGTIGILVNTLSLRDTAKLLERTKRAVTAAEKKYYMFVVGKPNVAKLGNFEVVDVWAILGCPQGGVIMDQDEYVKPIVTPYELELAFNDDWTGKWILDFGQVLTDFDDKSTAAAEPKQDEEPKHEEEPLFDLVTGKFVFGNTPLRQVEHLDINDREVATSSNALTIRNTVSTAAQKLQQRSWQGLGSDHAYIKGEYAELKKGRSGIARNYEEA